MTRKFGGSARPKPTCWRFQSNLGARRAFSLAGCKPDSTPPTGCPLDEVGAGTREVRISDAKGILRVMYVAKFEEPVYVLHCIQMKTQATSKHDKDIAAARYRAVVNLRKGKR
jgi:phage-related protein